MLHLLVKEDTTKPPAAWGKTWICTCAHWLCSTPCTPVLAGAWVFPLNAIAGVTGEVTPGVHFKAMGAGVSPAWDEVQHVATHFWGNVTTQAICSASQTSHRSNVQRVSKDKPNKASDRDSEHFTTAGWWQCYAVHVNIFEGKQQWVQQKAENSTYCGRKQSQTSVGWRGSWSSASPAVCTLDRSSSHSGFPTCSDRLGPEGSSKSPPHWSELESDTNVGL